MYACMRGMKERYFKKKTKINENTLFRERPFLKQKKFCLLIWDPLFWPWEEVWFCCVNDNANDSPCTYNNGRRFR